MARPAWTHCSCGEFWCNIHQEHVADCACPPVEDWKSDPYSMTAQTTAQRQEALRARRAMLGLTEVRGIYLPPALHPKLKQIAAKLKAPKPAE
jgi:hypothetical protein